MSQTKYFLFPILLAAFLISSCGSATSNFLDPQIDPSVDNGNTTEPTESAYETEWHNFFNSQNYSGYIAVMFKADTEARLKEAVQGAGLKAEGEGFVILSGTKDLRLANDSITRSGGTIRRGMDLPEETIDAALERAESEGKKLHDWNLYYTIEVSSAARAEDLYAELADSDLVEWIHPIPLPQLADIGDVTGGGAGLTEQLYFGADSATRGMNIQPAYDAGYKGQGVRILDEEYNWNFTHEALSVDASDIVGYGDGYPPGFNINDPAYVQHGTAVAGTITGNNSNRGQVKGIAHESELKFYRADITDFSPILAAAMQIQSYAYGGDASGRYAGPGDIILVEIQVPGPLTPASTGCQVNTQTQQPTYCMPIEAYANTSAAIQDATELGVIVVEGAGNGGVDLGDPNARLTACGANPCPDLGTADAGAIMVAASNGYVNNNKPWWSNWGTRVNAFAWGYDVVSTGYGDHPASVPSDANAWYTKNFNGTSSAAALVAGSLAVVQSFTKEYYKTILPHKSVYLDAAQMRALISLAGTASSASVNIGKKPDVAAMIQLVQDKVVVPRVAPDNDVHFAPKYVVAGTRYDIDGDRRADLISYQSDGSWKIDLSTVAPTGGSPDNYGAWDLHIILPSPAGEGQGEGAILYPAVHDYDSDGKADLAVYDSKSGEYFIKFTTADVILSGAKNPPDVLTYDLIIDYSTSTGWKQYSRPMPGDFNTDNYLDIGFVTSDGHWLMDFGGAGRLEKQGTNVVYISDFDELEKDVKYLTDSQLAEAPGWAYHAFALPRSGSTMIIYRVPDGVDTDAGRLGFGTTPDYNSSINTTMFNNFYGDNDDVLSGMYYAYNPSSTYFPSAIMLKNDTGLWQVASSQNFSNILTPPFSEGYGGFECKVVAADYNNDGTTDRAVKCGSSWRIVYSGTATPSYRDLELEDDVLSLPPSIYAGGMNYQEIKGILEYYGLTHQYATKDPFTPHTIDCIRYWAPPPPYCLAK